MSKKQKDIIFSKKQKEQIGNYFFAVTVFVEIIVLGFIFLTAWYLYQNPGEMFKSLAIGLVLLWIGILVAYYSWAIYFYNINFGITARDWEKIEDSRGTFNALDEPSKNPNSEETFGLPPGTVRGSIALTLLVGALAMTLVSFGKDDVLKENEIFTDNFEFFKTAFIMMIAFYFGQKSLEYLLPAKKPASVIAPETTSPGQAPVPANFTRDGAQG